MRALALASALFALGTGLAIAENFPPGAQFKVSDYTMTVLSADTSAVHVKLTAHIELTGTANQGVCTWFVESLDTKFVKPEDIQAAKEQLKTKLIREVQECTEKLAKVAKEAR